MVQAARSGVRNISEGSGAAATSRKSEMKLTNVARASLADELLRDYETFLIQNGLQIWNKDSRKATVMRDRLRQDQATNLPTPVPGSVQLSGLSDLADFVERADPEIAANAMICAVHQAVYLLNRQLKSQSETFVQEGGFTERLYNTRAKSLNNNKSVSCPLCESPMVKRKVQKGAQAGNQFWGCTAYPNCKGTRPIKLSDPSDMSDTSD